MDSATGARLELIEAEGTASSHRRAQIIQAALQLLAEGGREAVSTRAVSTAAGVQPPTIYRLFGDMRGLLDAVAAYGFSRYVLSKVTGEGSGDPVADLRAGWDAHVNFGLSNPALYVLMYGDPQPGATPVAATEAERLLNLFVQRIAKAGRLRVSVETAAQMIHAGALGVVLSLIASGESSSGNLTLSALMREMVLGAIMTDAPLNEPTPGAERVAARAVALQVVLADAAESFTPAEGALLMEWLDRLTTGR